MKTYNNLNFYEVLVQQRKDIPHADETLKYVPRYCNYGQLNFGINE